MTLAHLITTTSKLRPFPRSDLMVACPGCHHPCHPACRWDLAPLGVPIQLKMALGWGVEKLVGVETTGDFCCLEVLYQTTPPEVWHVFPEKLPKPNRKGSPSTIFQGAILNFGGVASNQYPHLWPFFVEIFVILVGVARPAQGALPYGRPQSFCRDGWREQYGSSSNLIFEWSFRCHFCWGKKLYVLMIIQNEVETVGWLFWCPRQMTESL